MAHSSPIMTAYRGRASGTAWAVLCLLAFAQGVLVVRAISKRAPVDSKAAATAKTPGPEAASATAAAPAAAPAPAATRTTMAPPAPGTLAPSSPGAPDAPSTRATAPPPVGSFDLPTRPATPVSPPVNAPPASATPPAPTATAPAAAPSAALNRPSAPGAAADPGAMSIKEMVDLAKQVRGLGDMQGALEVLKRADLQKPDDPAVMAEMAQCYETMGLMDKATALWRRLEAMDPVRAAGFRELAGRRLEAAPLTSNAGSASPAAGVDAGSKVLTLGACQAQRDAATVNGEKVVLRIPILRHGMSTIDPNQVDIDVFFFDRVNGEKVAQTIANEPVSTWTAPPVDWSGVGEEPLDVTYFLPALTPGEIQNHGRRSYHGYVVRLYYQHKLQDVAAEPRDLLEFGSRAPQSPGAGNPLLPPVSQ